MRFLRQFSARSAVAAALASAACSPGSVYPLQSPDAGVEVTNTSGFGGLGGTTASEAGRSSLPSDPPFGGSGGNGAVFSPCPADPSETPLVDALNEAITRGDFCVHRRLMIREDLRCDAYNLAAPIAVAEANVGDGGTLPSWVAMAVGWHALPGGSGRAWWATAQAADVNAARDAMLSEDFQEICDSAQRVPYKWVAVSHIFDTWVVELKADMP